jgi:uncharacterized membrane protein YqjE
MAANDSSIVEVVKSAVRDAQDLVRGEIALAKAEAREEVRRVGKGAALLAAAALAAVIGLVFLMTTVAWALSDLLGWPIWAGFAIVMFAMLLAAGALAYVGKRSLGARRHMPRTVDTFKENMQWIRARRS